MAGWLIPPPSALYPYRFQSRFPLDAHRRSWPHLYDAVRTRPPPVPLDLSQQLWRPQLSRGRAQPHLCHQPPSSPTIARRPGVDITGVARFMSVTPSPTNIPQFPFAQLPSRFSYPLIFNCLWWPNLVPFNSHQTPMSVTATSPLFNHDY
jgi:hypothetical protein